MNSCKAVLGRGKTRGRGGPSFAAGVLLLLGSIVSANYASSQSTPQNTTPAPCVASNGITPICGVHAPEDIELLPDDRHLLISEFPADFSRVTGDGLLLVDLATHRVQSLISAHILRPVGVREAATHSPRILAHMESISQDATMVGRNCSWSTTVNANQSKR